MGAFTINTDPLDQSYATGEDRIGVLLDGKAPAPKPAPVAAPAPKPAPAPAPADTGPGFWSNLGSGIANLAGKAVDAAKAIELPERPISGAQTNAVAQLEAIPAPSSQPPWLAILAGLAGLGLLLALLRR